MTEKAMDYKLLLFGKGFFQHRKEDEQHGFLDPFQVSRAVRLKAQNPGLRRCGSEEVE